MLKIDIDISPEILEKLRAMPERARRELKERVQQEVRRATGPVIDVAAQRVDDDSEEVNDLPDETPGLASGNFSPLGNS